MDLKDSDNDDYLGFHVLGLCKKIDKLAKKKECEDVGEWWQSISNHMYWCAASTPDGNGQMMQEKWKILPFHIQNTHENNNSQLYPECGHGELQGEAKDRLWLEPGEQVVTVIWCGKHKYSLQKAGEGFRKCSFAMRVHKVLARDNNFKVLQKVCSAYLYLLSRDCRHLFLPR